MKSIFRTVFYLRSNYVNKDGKTPILLRIYLNNERMCLGSTGIAVNANLWSNDKERLKGRTSEVLAINLQLDNIQSHLQNIYKKHEFSENISLECIKSEYIGNNTDNNSIMKLFEQHNENVKAQVGISLAAATLQKYEVCRKHFSSFLKSKYNRTDLKVSEITYLTVYDFDIYLRTVIRQKHNTATKTMKTLKTITIWGIKLGVIKNDPFIKHRFRLNPVDRGYLTDEEIEKIMKKEIKIPRLELVRDMFIFSCFTGLAYIDVANLTPDNIVTMNDREWLMTKRAKTDIETNILLLDIPKAIIGKYNKNTYREGKLFPIISNQKMNAYLKEIADLCGIQKNLTCHLARHTFATMSLSKGVPMESVSKMLGHTNIRTTQIYARITNKKIEHDMEQFAEKLDKFNIAMGI